jgi:hypothetical protein
MHFIPHQGEKGVPGAVVILNFIKKTLKTSIMKKQQSSYDC